MVDWTYVEDGLPRYEQRVLISRRHKNYPSNDRVEIARRVRTDHKGEWWMYETHSEASQGVTAWAPLLIAPPLPDSAGEKS